VVSGELGILLLEGFAESADKAADFFRCGYELRLLCGIYLAEAMGDHYLCFEFLERASGNGEEVNEITSSPPSLTFGNIGRD